jgi:O-antigen/teichoic acid export membrane protein
VKCVAGKKGQSLARGTSVMVLMVTLAKVLGLLWIVPLSRLIHEEGIGIYSQAYSLYIFVLTLSTAGFPTAMGKLIAEKLALRKYADVEQLYRITMRTVILFGLVLFFVTWFGAPLYGSLTALKESHQARDALTMSIRALAPALLVVPLESALRGYMQGFQKLEPSAYSQAVEQLFRVATIVIGADLVMSAGGSVAAGAAAATLGAFVGALAGVILLIFSVIPLRRRFLVRVAKQQAQLTQREALRTLMKYALPVSLGSLVVPISGMVDSLTITNFLMLAGDSYTAANAAYGIFSRQAMQLIQLPLAFAMALGVSVLPAIAEANAVRNQTAVEIRIRTTIRSMMFMTLPVAATLLVLGRPLDQLLSGDTKGAVIISSVCFMGIFSSLELISTYMLQGLGKMYRPVRNMFIGVVVKIVMNLVLILPFHIIGAAIATTLGYLVSTSLNVSAVRKYSNVHFSVWKLSAPLILASIVCSVGLFIGDKVGLALAGDFTSPDVKALIEVISGIAVGGVLYLASTLWFRAVSPSELQRIPFVGRRLSPLAQRMQRRRSA